jgi:predicted Rossmann fold flavoprotein
LSEDQVVIVGAGAAGLMASIFAAESGARVLLLERTSDGGKKILISGGGRCNVLPSEVDLGRFVTASSQHSLRKILLSWPLEEQRRFFEDLLEGGLVLEPETGKLFPASNRARDVRDALLKAARDRRVELGLGQIVTDVRPSGGTGWLVRTKEGNDIPAAAVILATGGLSVPRTGSDGTGLRIAGALGHQINDTYPALTPLTADPNPHSGLAGISLDVTIRAPLRRGNVVSHGGFLFTHRGYSGPSVLDVSHLTILSSRDARRQDLFVQWAPRGPDDWDRDLRESRSRTVGSLVRRHIPSRLADALIREAGLDPEHRLAGLRRDARVRLVGALSAYPLPWTGDEGYRKAEVTGGGVDLGQVDPRTLESRIASGLFLCGELLDAFGPIGGYNFLWAWATGRAAGRGAGRYVAGS